MKEARPLLPRACPRRAGRGTSYAPGTFSRVFMMFGALDPKPALQEVSRAAPLLQTPRAQGTFSTPPPPQRIQTTEMPHDSDSEVVKRVTSYEGHTIRRLERQALQEECRKMLTA